MNGHFADKRQAKILQFDRPADFYYRMAREKFAAGDIPGATARARTAVEKEPEIDANMILLAELLLSAQRADEASLLLFSLTDRSYVEDPECSFLLGIASALLSDASCAAAFLDLYLDIAQSGAHVPLAQCMRACLQSFGSGCVPRSLRTVAAAALIFAAASQADTDARDAAARRARMSDCAPARLLPMVTVQPQFLLQFDPASDCSEEATRERFRVIIWQFVRLHESFRHAVAQVQSESNHEHLYRLLCMFHDTTVASDLLLLKGLAAYNAGHLGEAVDILSDVSKIDGGSIISEHYLRLFNNTGPDDCRPLPYRLHIPDRFGRQQADRLRSCGQLYKQDLLAQFDADPSLQKALTWSILYGPEEIFETACAVAARTGSPAAERPLRQCLLRMDRSDEAKRAVFHALEQMEASKPYQALFGERIVEYDAAGLHEIVPGAKVRAAAVARVIRSAGTLLGLPQLTDAALRCMKALRSAPRLSDMWRSPHEAAAACLVYAVQTPQALVSVCSASGAHAETAQRFADLMNAEFAERKAAGRHP